MTRHLLVGCCAALAVAGLAARAPAQPAVPLPLYRIVLTDGTSVDAYGEWVRVGDRVVFSLALDPQRDPPALRLSSVPADRVDVAATERYREALRAATYAVTRGDADFDALSVEVARLLSEAARVPDAGQKLALAERARKVLAEWPATHHSYRLDEVRQIHALVDDVVADLRATRGDTAFDLSLVAQVMPPPSVPLAPPPTLRETIAQVLGLSRLADSSSERVSLLRTASALARERLAAAPVSAADADAIARMATEVDGELSRELRVDAAYASFKARVLGDALRAAARADVRGVERIVTRARARDTALGHARPDVMSEVTASLERYLDTARQLRLARDQWNARKPILADYADRIAPALRALRRARPALDDVRTFSGPSVRVLTKTDLALVDADARLRNAPAPDEARGAHAIVLSAVQLARNAVRLRRDAIERADMQRARDASAAAAGALMMSDRARDDIERALKPPTVR